MNPLHAIPRTCLCTVIAVLGGSCDTWSHVGAPHGERGALDILHSGSDARFTWTASPARLHADEPGAIQVSLAIPEGIEVYRGDLRVDVEDAQGLTVGSPRLPEGRVVRRPGVDAPFVMYEGAVVVDLPVDAAAVEPGLYRVGLGVEVRGCSGKRCLGGAREQISTWVHVLDAATVARQDAPR